MTRDYRYTKFSQVPTNLCEKKQALEDNIHEKYPRRKNIYKVLSKEYKYKKLFAEIYGNRCAYCGLMVNIVSLSSFQIDHIVPSAVLKTRGIHPDNSISNLAFSCQICNHYKSNIDFSQPELLGLHPDKEKIKEIFYRDSDYYIKINNEENNESIQKVYDKLCLGAQLKRVDYLLMCLHDLMELHPEILEISRAYMLLLDRRSFFSPKIM